ncbi:MAG: acyltransferase [Rhodospirillales bacterium]|nr:acyltransferase [Rhodospirillales bacterium]
MIAALEVFLSHICIWNLSCGPLGRLPYLGDVGVVTFFVLSGYVIAYTADTKDTTAEKFAVSRMTRMYSVVVPAMALTIALEWVGRAYFRADYHAAYDSYQFRHIGIYLPLWLTFASEFWHLNEPIFTNGAFWSLCFEVWFYIGFGLWSFARGAGRWVALLAVLLLVGPKIDLLAPLWMVGAGAYHLQKRVRLLPRIAAVAAGGTAVAYVAVIYFGLDTLLSSTVNRALGGYPLANLQMAWKAPGYLVLALLVAAHILAMRHAGFDRLARFAKPAGWLASYTFSFYLTHLPLLRFYSAMLRGSVGTILVPAILTVITAVVFGEMTERRTGPWRNTFTRLMAIRVPIG